jgi:hypothetical protein
MRLCIALFSSIAMPSPPKRRFLGAMVAREHSSRMGAKLIGNIRRKENLLDTLHRNEALRIGRRLHVLVEPQLMHKVNRLLIWIREVNLDSNLELAPAALRDLKRRRRDRADRHGERRMQMEFPRAPPTAKRQSQAARRAHSTSIRASAPRRPSCRGTARCCPLPLGRRSRSRRRLRRVRFSRCRHARCARGALGGAWPCALTVVTLSTGTLVALVVLGLGLAVLGLMVGMVRESGVGVNAPALMGDG